MPELIEQLEHATGLTFAEGDTGNTCMANNNDELREEFRQIFTLTDVQCYLKAISQTTDQILIPKNETDFWTMVNSGKGSGSTTEKIP